MYYTHPANPARGSEAQAAHAVAAREQHAAGDVHDLRVCGYPHSGPHIVVRRESGTVAGWSFERYPERAQQFADECNALVPGDPAHVAMWDDSEWDKLPGEASS